MNENEEKYFVSLLFEALGELSELNERIKKLEVALEELSKNRLGSNSLIVENSGRTVSLTKLIESKTELSDEIKSDIDKAVDFILKYGKNIPYIINK